ncbi:related to membrane protein Dik6 [Sporisorium reilianum f. sp. reilianum]|uniref:Related to membrane protein Dik6 n=1 Tax=Sporisorium reilianum f. sp. reilianum TaxID=72559 RepID=A0A2N8UC90_9BASI|nr:related to membrane protein Dik6 [Sporisorium reilianum f. sp. reilianum]
MLRVPQFFKVFTPDDIRFPHEMQTNAELIAYANWMLRPKPSKPVEIYMICDIIQSVFTFGACAYVMLKKGRMKDARFLTLCKSAWGTPRSPISNLVGKRRKGLLSPGLSLMHLPIPHSAWVMNTFMISVGVAMVGYNMAITVLNARQRNWTHQAQNDVYHRLLIKQHTQEWLDSPPTEEDLYLVRLGVCGLENVFRLCCAALASYIVLIGITVAMLVLYAIPNHIFLIDHLCRIFPDKDFQQPDKRTLLTNIATLWKIGLPRNLQGPTYAAFKKTWMVTIVGHSQALLILLGLLTFAVPPLYLIMGPWSNMLTGKSSDHQVTFTVSYVITAAFVTATWIMALSAMLTFDDIFNTVSDLGNSRGGSAQTIYNRRDGPSISVGVSHGSNVATGLPSPQSPTFVQAPTQLRPMPSFSPSSAGSQGEKTFGDDMYGDDDNCNRVLVVIETTVHVDDADVEAPPADEYHSSADMYPRPPLVTAPRAKTYRFLGRAKSQ